MEPLEGMAPYLFMANVTADSESQFSGYYTTYNYYALDNKKLSNDSLQYLNSSTTMYFTETDFLVKYIICGVALFLICVFGMIGNICSVIVLLNKRMKSSVSCFLIGLAIADTTILTTCLISMAIPTLLSQEHIYPGSTKVYLSIAIIAPTLYSILVIGLTSSVLFTLTVSLERYLVVCHPFLARRICTWRRACQASFLIFLFSIVYNLPHWFDFTCETIYNEEGNNIGCYIKSTALRKNKIYDYYYIFLVHGFLHYTFPSVILIVLNLLIYLKIRDAKNNRRNLSVSDVKENSLAYMLFAVVAVFIACNGLIAVAMLYKIFEPDVVFPISLYGPGIFSLLMTLNSAVNFLIYCIYGEKFREVFYDVVSEAWRKLSRSRQRSNSEESSIGSRRNGFPIAASVKAKAVQNV